MKDNIREELRLAREEYSRLKEQLANAQYEANKVGRAYSSLFESFAPYNRQIMAIKKGSLQISEQEKNGDTFLVGDRNLEPSTYESTSINEKNQGHTVKLRTVVPLSSLGKRSIGVVVSIDDDDLVETMVEALKSIPFAFSLYITCSDAMNHSKMMDMCAEIQYLKHVELIRLSNSDLNNMHAMRIYRESVLGHTYLLLMDMADKSSAIRSMVNDLLANIDYAQRILSLLNSQSVAAYIASAAERLTQENGYSISYPYSAFYWITVSAIEEKFDEIFSCGKDKQGKLLAQVLHDADNRIAIGSFNSQIVKIDLNDGDYSEAKINNSDKLKELVAEKRCVLDASRLIRINKNRKTCVQPAIKNAISRALNANAPVYVINDLPCANDECSDILRTVFGDNGYRLFDKTEVYAERIDYPIYAFLGEDKGSQWIYIGGENCVNEKKNAGQYLREDNSFISYIAIPSAEDVLMTDFSDGFSALGNKEDLEEFLDDLHEIVINDCKESDGFIGDDLLEKLYEEKYSANESVASKLIIDRLTEIKEYEISEKSIEYNYWYRETAPSLATLQSQKETSFEIKPKFSIVIPVYRTKEYYLRRLLDSIKVQTYADFEVCIADASDYSKFQGEGEPRQILEEYSQRDSRFKYKILENNGGISANTNVAIEMASGDYIVFADHDDELTQDALFECAKTINEYPMAQILYSDEDKIDKNSEEFSDPHFKSDYNPEMLRCVNYFCHLLVIRRTLLNDIAVNDGGVKLYERPAFDGSQDYDLVLRCCEKAEELDEKYKEEYSDRYKEELENGLFTSFAIRHIPKVLYHWRVYELSTAGGEEDVKPYTVIAGKKALSEHCERMGIKNTGISDGISAGVYRINYEVDSPLVSVIIPNKDHTGDLDKAIRSIWNGSYKNVEFIVVENNSTNDETWKYYERIQQEIPAVKVVYYKGDFNYSAINNFGVKSAAGKYLLFLNNDTEMFGTESLAEMVALAQQSKIGIVGARLLYDDNTLQHAGIVVGIGGIAGNVFVAEETDRTYFNYAMFQRDYSSVTAAVLISSREVYDLVGGFSEDLAVAFNDVDYCLKVRSKGLRVAYSPYAVFHHYESKSRGTDEAPEKMARFHSEIVTFGEKWKNILIKGDPYYNRNLTLIEADYGLKMLGRETIGKPCYNELLMDVILTTEK